MNIYNDLELFPYFSVEGLQGQSVTDTIKDVFKKNVGTYKKPKNITVVSFHKDERLLKLTSKTNISTLVNRSGSPDTSNWKGLSLTLEVRPVDNYGEKVGSVQIVNVTKPSTKPSTKATTTKANTNPTTQSNGPTMGDVRNLMVKVGLKGAQHDKLALAICKQPLSEVDPECMKIIFDSVQLIIDGEATLESFLNPESNKIPDEDFSIENLGATA